MNLRNACLDDIPALEFLIDASVRELQAEDYTPEQIELALRTVFSVDTQLIEDGTYFVAERSGRLAGCGGWSRRKTLCGGSHHTVRDDALLDPARDAAKIRAMFVAPSYARQGLGSLILEAAEQAAAAEGFTRLEMASTLTGVPLYLNKGYRVVEYTDVPLGDNLSLAVVHMAKTISASR